MKKTTSADLVGKFLLRVVVLCALVGGFLLWASGAFAAHDGPSEWSLRGVASWAGPVPASGTALPIVASHTVGDFFVLYGTSMASPTLYRLSNTGATTTWLVMSSASTGSGVATHSDLANLSYATAGHTGFEQAGAATAARVFATAEVAALASITEPLIASGAALPATDTYGLGDLFLIVDPATTTVTLYCLVQGPSIIDWSPIAGVGFVGVATLTHDELEHLAFADSGHTGFASEAALAGYYTKTQADATISAAITEAGLGASGGGGEGTLLGISPGVKENIGQTWAIATDSSGVYWYALESAGEGIILGGDNNAKIYQSLDYGLTWGLASLTSAASINSLAHCGSGTIIAGTGAGGLIFRSLDWGGTWALASDTAATTLYSLAYCGQGIVLGFSGATGLIYRSTNYGASWVIATDTPDTNLRSSCYCGSGRVCAGGTASGAIWVSSDYGVTWSTATETGASIISSMVSLGNNVVLAGGEDTKTVYRSTDNGATWAAGFVASGAVSAMADCGGGIVAMGEGSTAIVYMSYDYGLTWALVENIAQTRIDSLCHAGRGVLLAGTDSNAVLYRSADVYSPSFTGLSGRMPSLATPTGPLLATGTHWYDQNENKVKVWDGAAWNALW